MHLSLHRTFPHELDDNSNQRNKASRTSLFLGMLLVNTGLRELEAPGDGNDPQDEFERNLSEVVQARLHHLRAMALTLTRIRTIA